MSRIRPKDTKPELILRKALFARGLRYRLNYRVAGYRVDIAFPSKKLAIFVDGCFWHGCPKCFRAPKSNKKYWVPKIATNKVRDRKIDCAIHEEGWGIIHVWEHEIIYKSTRQ
jgi:DNA mismatch endonuclease (patch repair protein)